MMDLLLLMLANGQNPISMISWLKKTKRLLCSVCIIDTQLRRSTNSFCTDIGSNVIAAPAAAQRALADGHTLCVHTWSHPAMTSQSNEAVVAELYWTMRAIKEVTGVTTKCWRPPYGDVDDRVRAIAWQMGLTTVLWDLDTNDWNMPGDGGGNLSPSVKNLTGSKCRILY